jgi:hypothetical protein
MFHDARKSRSPSSTAALSLTFATTYQAARAAMLVGELFAQPQILVELVGADTEAD